MLAYPEARNAQLIQEVENEKRWNKELENQLYELKCRYQDKRETDEKINSFSEQATK